MLQDIKTKKPKLVVMAFPCSPWSNLTYFQKDQARVRERQLRDRPFLRFVSKVAKVVKDYGGAWLIENPRWSRAWSELELQRLVIQGFVAEIDQCIYGLVSESGRAHRKPTRFLA